MSWRALTGRIAFSLLALLTALAPGVAGGEVLDELRAFPERGDAVVRISFSVSIQYLRHAAVGDGLVEIYFQILTADGSTVTETRRLAATPSFPGVEVTYPLQPRAQPQKMNVRFTQPVPFRVRPGGNRAIDLVIPDAAGRVVRAPAPAAAAVPQRETEARFAIRLDSFGSPDDLSRAPAVPGEFSDYTVFAARSSPDERSGYDIVLGYFSTAQAAEQIRKRLLRRFPNAEVVDLAPPPGPEPAQTATSPPAVAAVRPPVTPAPPAVPAMPAIPAAPEEPGEPAPPPTPPAPAASAAPMPAEAILPPTAAPASAEEVEARAGQLMTEARAALDAGNNTAATERLNQALMLPPNRHSQEAQELIGLARDRNGEFTKARAEYELYLKLFPDGEGAARVRDRLAVLSAPEAPAARRAGRAPLRMVTGTLSQYYYGGRTKIDSVFNTPTTVDRSSFSAIDQSALVTNLDLTARNRTASSDSRFVFRDTNNVSFLANRSSYNRLNAAYYDYRGIDHSFATRAGRQTGLTGGLPNRFDGATAGFGVTQNWRLNAAGGVPVEYPAIDSNRSFWGTNLEYENLGGAWSGNLFYVDQTVDGIPDRQAVGNETRYFRGGTSLFTLLDYDTSYKEWNIAMLQGTWQTEGRTSLNLLYDRRKAPLLTTTNAIFGQPTTSISTLLQSLTLEQVRQQARDVTATATQALLGLTTPVSEKWQAGADARFTNVGPLPAIVVNGIAIPAQPATGNIYSYDLQAIGTNLYSSRDTNVFSATYLTGPTQEGYQLAFNNLSLIAARWTVEPSLRYYTQKDTREVKLTRWMPGLRLTYLVRDNMALEGEFNWEKTRIVGPASQDDTSRGFFYLGYRWNI